MNYTVLKGDTLGTIAKKFLGSSEKWQEIWKTNPAIGDPNKISVGQILKIPGQSQALTVLVPVSKPVSKPVIQLASMRDVTNTVQTSLIQQLLQNKKLLMIVGIGFASVIYLTMKKTKGRAA